MFQDPTFWVLVAFLGFIVLLVYFKVPNLVTNVLDSRAEKIRADLDEADTLLKEAQDLLALYQKKQREVADEAAKIQAKATEEAEHILEIGNSRLEELLKRRENLALGRIKQAESTALDEIRSRTAEIALQATHHLLSNNLSKIRAEAMLEDTIKELPNKLN